MLVLMAYPEDGGGWAPASVIDHSVGHEDQYQYQYQSAGDWPESQWQKHALYFRNYELFGRGCSDGF